MLHYKEIRVSPNRKALFSGRLFETLDLEKFRQGTMTITNVVNFQFDRRPSPVYDTERPVHLCESETGSTQLMQLHKIGELYGVLRYSVGRRLSAKWPNSAAGSRLPLRCSPFRPRAIVVATAVLQLTVWNSRHDCSMLEGCGGRGAVTRINTLPGYLTPGHLLPENHTSAPLSHPKPIVSLQQTICRS